MGFGGKTVCVGGGGVGGEGAGRGDSGEGKIGYL